MIQECFKMIQCKQFIINHLHCPAESEGFEPPDLLQSTVFKTAAFDHSASSPGAKLGIACFVAKLFPLIIYVIATGQY